MEAGLELHREQVEIQLVSHQVAVIDCRGIQLGSIVLMVAMAVMVLQLLLVGPVPSQSVILLVFGKKIVHPVMMTQVLGLFTKTILKY